MNDYNGPGMMIGASAAGMGSAAMLQRNATKLQQEGPTRTPIIPEQLEGVAKRTESLAQQIDALAQRLSVVMTPELPAADGRGGTSQPPDSVPLAQILSEIAHRLDHASARVQSILARLEV